MEELHAVLEVSQVVLHLRLVDEPAHVVGVDHEDGVGVRVRQVVLAQLGEALRPCEGGKKGGAEEGIHGWTKGPRQKP